jgi:hypothetical protein
MYRKSLMETSEMGKKKPQDRLVRSHLDLLAKDFQRLDKQAAKHGLVRSAMARMIIVRWLDEQERSEKH